MSLSPLLTATPTTPPTYNVGMAETFSWIPVEGAGRPLYARATYLANPEDIKVSLSAGNINVSLDELELNTDQLEELIAETNTNLSSIQIDLNSEFDETQTLLNALTALQTAKQNQVISLLSALTGNTDQVEGLITSSNTLLNSLTALTQNESNETQTLLNSLTALQDNKQSTIITLLHQLTANTDSLEINTDGIESLISNSNTRLSILTAVDFATSAKQNSIITLLNSLTAKETTISLDVSAINLNTDEIEGLIEQSNTLLEALTAKTTITDVSNIETKLDVLTAVNFATYPRQDTSNTLLSQLTSIQTTKQDQIITLLHSITGSAIEVDLNTDQLEVHVDEVETLLRDLTASNKYVPGFSIPPYNEITFSYVGSTDIFRTVTYLNNSTQVMALSFTYITEPPTVGNSIIQSVKKI